MNGPWTDGPRELIQHAVDHLDLGGDFDRRVAMISIDNAVELTIKTYLGLPERARGSKGPGRKELEAASESFPGLLDLLEKYASQWFVGLSLDDVEWYHRLRNQLYHSGNGITVEMAKAETYLELAISLFESLFGAPPALQRGRAVQTKTGQFLQLWVRFEHGLRTQLPPKDTYAYIWKRNHLETLGPETVPLYDSVSMFRNELVHGLSTPDTKEMEAMIAKLKKLMALAKIDIA